MCAWRTPDVWCARCLGRRVESSPMKTLTMCQSYAAGLKAAWNVRWAVWMHPRRRRPPQPPCGELMRIKWCLVLVSLVSLTGCALQRARIADRAQHSLLGLSEGQLLQCAGAPAYEKKAGSLSFLTYHGGGDGLAVSLGGMARSPLGVSTIQHRYCDATFVLRNGRVADLRYRGRTGGLLTRNEQCAFIVEQCVGR